MNEELERNNGAAFAGLPGSLERPREADPDGALARLGGAGRGRAATDGANGSHLGGAEAHLLRRMVIRLGGNGF